MNDQPDRTAQTFTVWGCAQCGNTHYNVLFRRFVGNPLAHRDGTIYDLWGICPSTGDPILMRTIDRPKTDKESDNHNAGWELGVADLDSSRLATMPFIQVSYAQPLTIDITPEVRLTCSDWKALFENNPEMVESLGAAILEWIGFKRRKMDVYTGDGFTRPSEGER